MVRRIRQMQFQQRHPDAPWLAEPAVLLLDSYLKPSGVGLEWGSGRSTVWFARRVACLTSVEHSAKWSGAVQQWLRAAGVAERVVYHKVPCDLGEFAEPESHPYLEPALTQPDGSLDFVLVDGMIRAACMWVGLSKLKPGGLLVLDNANRFVPNCCVGKPTTVHEPRLEPRSERWREIIRELEAWRWLHTTDGIWDTRFWIKPRAGGKQD